MKQPDRKKSRRGFTLLEVMVATGVFAIAAMGLVALNKVAMNASTYGRERTAAANLAQFAMTWIENEVAAYASAESAVLAVKDGYLTRVKETVGLGSPETSWMAISGSGGSNVRFDEYLSNETDAKYATVDTAQYCIHYRLLITNGPGSLKALPGNLFHAAVLVTWPRERGYATSGDSDWTDCSTRLADPSAADGAVPANYNTLILEQILTRDFSNKLEAN